MSTINISLPNKLKNHADELIAEGHYASFSDLARTGIRQIVRDHKLDRLVAEAKREYKSGKGTVLRTAKDVDRFMAQFKPRNT